MSTELFEVISRLLQENVDPVARRKMIEESFAHERAVLILDSSGFTRVTESHGIIHYLECLVKARDIIQSTISRLDLIEFHFHADNLFAQFPGPVDAVNAAFEIHEAISRAEIYLTDDETFGVCIGIGYGEVLISDSEGCHGHEVNLASRLGEDIANPGEVLITAASHSQLPSSMASRFESRTAEFSGEIYHYFHSHHRN